MKEPVNKFFDINRLPETAGQLVFYVSPSKALNGHSADKYFEYMKYFTFEGDEKIKEPEVGLNIVYGDTLYLYSDEQAANLKNKLLSKIVDHKNKFIKLLDENPQFIKKAVNFTTWNQLLFENKSFLDYFGKIKKLYQEDEKFQEFVKKDFEETGKRPDLDEYQMNFFLEEILVFYLTAKKQLSLHNDFTQGNEKWMLNCYPRKPLWSHIYLQQLNPFDLESEENKFENSYYDLENKILYDFDRLDLETIDFSEFS